MEKERLPRFLTLFEEIDVTYTAFHTEELNEGDGHLHFTLAKFGVSPDSLYEEGCEMVRAARKLIEAFAQSN